MTEATGLAAGRARGATPAALPVTVRTGPVPYTVPQAPSTVDGSWKGGAPHRNFPGRYVR
jgi:hypothetical protein